MAGIQRVLFMGSKRLGLRALVAMRTAAPDSVIGAITIDDRSDVRNAFEEFHKYANESGLRLETANNRRHAEQLIAEFRPDLCFVVGWYWLITDETLKIVPHGFIGIHNSLLPKYRGGSPLVWALINGEREVGFSLFSFTQGMDDGPIWAQKRFPVGDEDTISDLLGRFEDQAVLTLHSSYADILNGKIAPQPQPHAEATFCAQRQAFDGAINWLQPAHRVHDFIRAQTDPYPGAFTYLRDEKLTIWRSRCEPDIFYGTPGQVAAIGTAGVRVVCGDNRGLEVLEVEFQGKRLPASEVLRSIRIRFPQMPGLHSLSE